MFSVGTELISVLLTSYEYQYVNPDIGIDSGIEETLRNGLMYRSCTLMLLHIVTKLFIFDLKYVHL